MKSTAYLLIGVLFGIILIKSEAASWYRVYEMFLFQSFHMYGIIGSSVVSGILMLQLLKRFSIKSFFGADIIIPPKEKAITRYLAGGTLFGLGWALTGACPGPLFALVGAGFFPVVWVIIFSILGTYLYGILKDKLPH